MSDDGWVDVYTGNEDVVKEAARGLSLSRASDCSVCEWEWVADQQAWLSVCGEGFWHPASTTQLPTSFTYCPYCGRKIVAQNTVISKNDTQPHTA